MFGWVRRIAVALALAVGLGPAAAAAEKLWDLKPDEIRTLVRSSQVVARRTAEGGIDAYCHCPVVLEPDEVPPLMLSALIAIEDRKFFARETAFDWTDLAGAIVKGRGGSTIAMQLLKNLALGAQPKMQRKLLEVQHADALLSALGREGTIVAYLNQVNFGGREVTGLYRAARHHFGKEPRDLDLWEMAVLAGTVVNPKTHNPSSEREQFRTNAEARARLVLSELRRQGRISATQHEEALRRAVRLRQAREPGKRPGSLPPLTVEARPFVAWLLREHGGLVTGTGAVRFFVTFDALQQSGADRQMARLSASGDLPPGYRSAAVVMSSDGKVQAIVGSRDWARDQFDAATRGSHQIGSTAKLPLVVAACEAGLRGSTSVLDAPASDGPDNGAVGYAGETTFEDVIVHSRNAGAVHLAREIGLRKVKAAGARLGLPDVGEDANSYVLGTYSTNLLTLTAAYATIANGGTRARPNGLLAAFDGEANVLTTNLRAVPGDRVVGGPCATFTRDLLRTVVDKGTGRGARLPLWPAFGKTGTTNDNIDGLFVGWSGGRVIGFWMGKARDGQPGIAAGGVVPAKFFRLVATEAAARADQRRLVASSRAGPPPRPKAARKARLQG